MATVNATDYLGHPSRLAEALAYFDLEEGHKLQSKEPRSLPRQIGMQLMEINCLVSQAPDALSFVENGLEGKNECDADKVAALIAMIRRHSLETADAYFRLAGLVCVALEAADMVKANVVVREVSHG